MSKALNTLLGVALAANLFHNGTAFASGTATAMTLVMVAFEIIVVGMFFYKSDL